MPRPSRRARRALDVAKTAVIGALTAVALSGAVSVQAGVDAAESPEAPTPSPRLAALMDRLECSTTGLGQGVIPGSALIRQDDRVRQVSFDDGWAAFTENRPGTTLVAVCRADLDA